MKVMERRLYLNSARLCVGRHVNLHLRDGSVIVNVRVTSVERSGSGKKTYLHYAAPKISASMVSLREVERMELLNPLSFT